MDILNRDVHLCVCEYAAGEDAHAQCMKLNLSDLDSVKEMADDFKSKNVPLHGLINNAGVFDDRRDSVFNAVFSHRTALESSELRNSWRRSTFCTRGGATVANRGGGGGGGGIPF